MCGVLVMHQNVCRGDPILADGYHFHVHTTQADTLVAILPKISGLPCSITSRVSSRVVLSDSMSKAPSLKTTQFCRISDKRRASCFAARSSYGGHHGLVAVDAPRRKGGPGAQSQSHRAEGLIDVA